MHYETKDNFSLWFAPAKLNLMLRITGQRADGYHTLQTVFQFLEYGDRLSLRRRADGQILRLNPLSGVHIEQDLTIRSARLLQQASGTPYGVEIFLEKNLPIGGGLGGGSSDAATVLVALNQLWETGFSEDDLAALGIRLGADVPVFVRGRAAWAEGVGEILTPLELPEPWYLMIVPNCQVATREIFAAPELPRNSPPITMAEFNAGADNNDCTAVVRHRYPEVGAALDWLGEKGRLTGTGACVYAAFPDAAIAHLRLTQLPTKWRGFVARGCNRSWLYSLSL